jgi:membrane protease subunit HflK
MNEKPTQGPFDPTGPGQKPVDAGSQALAEALRSSFAIVKVVMVLLVLVFLGSGFFTVGPSERAIILRFGRPAAAGEKALLNPGLQWSLPYPIDEVVRVPISSIQQVRSTVGWYATTPVMEAAGTEPPVGPNQPINPAVDGYAITADGNIVHSRATLTYRISDPISYVFNFVNASNAVQNALDDALLFSAAHFNVDDIVTRDVIGFKDAVRKRVTALVEIQKLGVTVEQCDVQSKPPRQLKDAFDSVLKAEVTRNKVLNDARSFENQVLSKAGADAQSRTNLADSERIRLLNDVTSRADQFQQLLPQYRMNPNLFAQQRLTEALGRVFTNAQDKILVPETADGNSMELRYLINREPPKAKEEPAKP